MPFLYGVKTNPTIRYCHISQMITDKMPNLFIRGRTWTYKHHSLSHPHVKGAKVLMVPNHLSSTQQG